MGLEVLVPLVVFHTPGLVTLVLAAVPSLLVPVTVHEVTLLTPHTTATGELSFARVGVTLSALPPARVPAGAGGAIHTPALH